MSITVLKLKKAVHYFLKELKADENEKDRNAPFKCPICNAGIDHFNPIDRQTREMMDKYQVAYPMYSFETFNFFDYACPKCWSSDRERLYMLYFKKNYSRVPEGKKYNLLDIAPGPFSNFLKKLPYINHRSADLYQPADDKVDITNMDIYEDGRFDIFLCSHVLEHVKEDIKAMKELHRVLKPGGWGIAMVPINLSIEDTFEDDNIASIEDKWKYYGQDDHVRMYSKKGFVNNLKKAGFKVNEYGIEYFGAEDFKRHGIHPRSVLYIVEKL